MLFVVMKTLLYSCMGPMNKALVITSSNLDGHIYCQPSFFEVRIKREHYQKHQIYSTQIIFFQMCLKKKKIYVHRLIYVRD